jgi:hypothetical protein
LDNHRARARAFIEAECFLSSAIGGPLEALPLPAPEAAVGVINEQLGIDGAITHKGDQLKCYTRDIEEGGVSKTYLGAAECQWLARAFAALAALFTRKEGEP